MTDDPATVTPATTITEAALLMARRRVRRLPVVDERKHLVGIVSELDIARAFPPDLNPFSPMVETRPSSRRVGEVMTPDPVSVMPSTPIDEAAQLLRSKRIGAVPVVSAEQLVGILTESDVFRAFIELLGVSEQTVRVTFDVSNGEDVLGLVEALAKRHHLRIASILSFDHDGKRFAVTRLSGAQYKRFVDDAWSSGHRVVSVSHPE